MWSLFWIGAAILTAIVIWKACDPFSDAAHFLGRNIPQSVRGATIDAVASSLPELFSTFLFLMVYDEYASGVATCAGSALYNMLVIPAICVLLVRNLQVSSEVVWRDGVYYVASQLLLVLFLASGKLTWYMGLGLILMYVGYTVWLYLDARNYRRRRRQRPSESGSEDGEPEGGVPEDGEPEDGEPKDATRFTPKKAWLVVLVSTVVVGVACHLLVTACVRLAGLWGVAPYFVAVIIAAAATSVPDTFISIFSARKGDSSGAVANAFGSNIFDINICLGLPLLIYCATTGQTIELKGSEITTLWVLLIVSSVVTLVLFGTRYRIGRAKGVIMLLVYIGFLVYVVLEGLSSGALLAI
jgi:cation:H+ antiporter